MSRTAWILAIVVVVVLLGGNAVFAVKPGALPSNDPRIEYARRIVVRVWAKYGYAVTVTSGEEPHTTHRAQSKHYEGLAEDYRTRDVARSVLTEMVNEVRSVLGRDYDVILENLGTANEHLHIEYDPK